MLVNWKDPKYRNAPGGSLESWQKIAASYIAFGSVEERDTVAIEVGRRCHTKTAAGIKTCVWHETSLYCSELLGKPVPCNCRDCRGADVGLSAGWSEQRSDVNGLNDPRR